MLRKTTFSRFTTRNSSSFRAVLLFFATYAEIKAFNWLKALFFLFESAKTKKEPLEMNCKKNRFLGTCKPANCFEKNLTNLVKFQKCLSPLFSLADPRVPSLEYVFKEFGLLFPPFLAGLHLPKERFFLLVLFERFFFLLTEAEKMAFSQLKAFLSAYKKKKRSKRTSKKDRYFGARKPAKNGEKKRSNSFNTYPNAGTPGSERRSNGAWHP